MLGVMAEQLSCETHAEHPDFPGSRIRHLVLEASMAAASIRAGLHRRSHKAGIINPASPRESSKACEQLENAPDDSDSAVPHAIDTAGGKVCLQIVEDVASSGPAGRVWDASIALAEHLLGRFGRDGLAGVSVLELGAGAGLPGIVAAMQVFMPPNIRGEGRATTR
jgi:hypothetical protein